jgi:O-antigen ligase
VTAGAVMTARSAWQPAVASPAVTIHPLVRWAFYGFVLSLPFEYPNRSFAYEITMMSAAGFLATTILQPRACFRAPPAAVWWLFGFLYAFGAAYVAAGGRDPSGTWKLFLLLVLIVLVVWVGGNLLRDGRVRTGALVALAVGCVILALLQLSNVANAAGEELQRATVLGQNSNRTGRMLSLGMLAVIGLAYARRDRFPWLGKIAWVIIPALGIAILQGGSRGALLALALALSVFALSGRTFAIQVRNAVVTMVVLVLLALAAVMSPLMQQRFARAEAGNLAGRERIFPAAWSMVRDRPLLGWGPGNNKDELAVRLRLPPQLHASRDTHNLVLEVLTSTGLVGGFFYFFALAFCARNAWRARRGSEGLIPAAMMIAMLAGNMSGNYLMYMPYSFVLAYASASGMEDAC